MLFFYLLIGGLTFLDIACFLQIIESRIKKNINKTNFIDKSFQLQIIYNFIRISFALSIIIFGFSLYIFIKNYVINF